MVAQTPFKLGSAAQKGPLLLQSPESFGTKSIDTCRSSARSLTLLTNQPLNLRGDAADDGGICDAADFVSKTPGLQPGMGGTPRPESADKCVSRTGRSSGLGPVAHSNDPTDVDMKHGVNWGGVARGECIVHVDETRD